MTGVELIIPIIIAAAVGAIAHYLVGNKNGNLFIFIVFGFLGALFGAVLARLLGLPYFLPIQLTGIAFPLIWSIVGASLLVLFLGSYGRRRKLAWKLSPPTRSVLGLSAIFAGIGYLIAIGLLPLPISPFGLMTIAYIVLLLGVLIKGL